MNVSVIIPVYNAEKYIKKAIESCLQLPEVKEIIVVDDGYKDGAKEIVRELALKNTIIKLYEHPDNVNMGAGPSRNLGIEKATQEYIAFLDADDFFLSHRFDKDKEVFKNNPDADGCYNAIGCHFYSESAKKIFLNHFQSTTTTVNPKINPTPKNLFKGRIGMIANYGNIHLNGLTVKCNCLQKDKVSFPSLSVHQDTVFINQLSYYAKLYPSQIIEPVALRGVHEENRITENYQSKKIKQYNNQFQMWNLLYNWGRKENIGKKEINYMRKITAFYKLLSATKPQPIELVNEILVNPRLLFNEYYPQLHTAYFGNSTFVSTLLKIRNALNKPLSKILKNKITKIQFDRGYNEYD